MTKKEKIVLFRSILRLQKVIERQQKEITRLKKAAVPACKNCGEMMAVTKRLRENFFNRAVAARARCDDATFLECEETAKQEQSAKNTWLAARDMVDDTVRRAKVF